MEEEHSWSGSTCAFASAFDTTRWRAAYQETRSASHGGRARPCVEGTSKRFGKGKCAHTAFPSHYWQVQTAKFATTTTRGQTAKLATTTTSTSEVHHTTGKAVSVESISTYVFIRLRFSSKLELWVPSGCYGYHFGSFVGTWGCIWLILMVLDTRVWRCCRAVDCCSSAQAEGVPQRRGGTT